MLVNAVSWEGLGALTPMLQHTRALSFEAVDLILKSQRTSQKHYYSVHF